MNKKILIGSIVMVTVLIGVSFTSVVSYGSVKSNVKSSPLFNMRTSRAIDRDNKDIACDYVGKGEESVLTIPKRDNRTSLQQKIIDIISKTDDKIFNIYLNMLINQIQKNDKYDDVNINEVITAIHQLRGNPDRINLNAYKNSDVTWRDEFIPTLCWFPGCFILSYIKAILGFIWWVWWVTNIYTRDYNTCFCPPPLHHNPP